MARVAEDRAPLLADDGGGGHASSGGHGGSRRRTPEPSGGGGGGSSSSDLLAARDDSLLLQLEGRARPPPDKYRLVLSTFLLMGLGMLFPWNSFITANDFWRSKFEGSSLVSSFQRCGARRQPPRSVPAVLLTHPPLSRTHATRRSYFSVAYNLANIFSLFVLLRLAERLRIGTRILAALAVTTVAFVVITSLVYVDGIAPGVYFAIAMVAIVACGIATGLFQNGMFALSSHFAPNYTGAVMTGQGLAGTVVSLAQILTLLAGGDNYELSALLYFLVTLVLLLACLGGYMLLQRLPFFRFYYRHPGGGDAGEGDDAGAGSADGGAGGVDSPADSSLAASKERLRSPASGDLDDDAFDPLLQHAGPSYAEVFRQLWPTGVGVLYVFVVTLSLFPSIVSVVLPLTEGSSSRLFDPEQTYFVSFAFLLFNISDLAGRWMAEWRRFIPYRFLLPASLLRTVFFPLLLLSNIDPEFTGDVSLPLLVSSDWLYFTVLLLFGYTNGYIASSCMIMGPQHLPPEHREKGGVVMVNCLVLGLFLGSMLSFGLLGILCRCNSFTG